MSGVHRKSPCRQILIILLSRKDRICHLQNGNSRWPCLRSACGQKVRERCSLAFPPKYTTACLLILGLHVHVPMSEERNCDESHKWKFDQFGTLDYKSKKIEKSKIVTSWLFQTRILETSQRHKLFERQQSIAKSQKMQQNNLTHQRDIGGKPLHYGG